MKSCFKILVNISLFFVVFSNKSNAQFQNLNQNNDKSSAVANVLYNIFENTSFGGTFQTQFVSSVVSEQSDEDEIGQTIIEKSNNQTFSIKKAKLKAKTKITDKTKVVLSGSVSSNSTNDNILGDAYISHKFNNNFKFRVGQFRPLAGIESTYSSDIVKSMSFSTQYSNFGKNGWTGNQVGADLSYNVDFDKLVMSYTLGVFNGNGKNITDDDNGKNFFLRNSYYFPSFYNLKLGLNGGLGKVQHEETYMIALDATTNFPIMPKLSFFIESQLGRGINHILYFKDKEKEDENCKISDFVMQGWYILPNLRYEVGKNLLHSLELSCRYEQWKSEDLSSNVKHSLIPALSLEFLKDYNLRLTMAWEMNRYTNEMTNIFNHDSDIFTTRLQAKF